jgi:anhydro-N-acetylmuramic acid kinase
LVAGVLSGTSGDGIDVVLAEPRLEAAPRGHQSLGDLHQVAFRTSDFPGDLSRRVREALDGAPLGPRELALLSRDLGLAFGDAVRALGRELGRAPCLVGSHGLTVYHHDGAPGEAGASMQLGEGDHVAERARCTAVTDFRQRDLAAGGEGAPISILADDAVFRRAPRPTAVLNLGGLANLSWLGAEGELLAFDTGPAGCLLDGFARRLLHEPYDPGGVNAARGRPRPELLARWLEHPFFLRRGPRSTGRDTFGEAWVQGLLAGVPGAEDDPQGGGPSVADLFATAVELVATTVADGLEELPERPPQLWVAGGGVHNPILVAALARRIGLPVVSTAELGVDPDAREALVFAALAVRCVLGEGVTRTSATGARGGRILGKISPEPR